MSDFDLASGEGLIDTIPVSDSRTLRQGKAPLNARQRRFLRAQEASRDSVLADRLEATLVDAEQGGLRRSWNNFWRADAIMREASQEHGAFSVASREAADLEMAALNAVSVMSEERREVFTGLLVRSREGTQSVLDRMQALTRTLGHAHAEATLAHDVVAVIQGMDERLQQEVLGQTAQALQQSGELVQTKARGFGGMLSAVRQGKFGVRDLIAGYKGEFYNATIGGVTHMLDARQRQAYILAKARGQEVRMERHIGDNVKETYGGMAFRNAAFNILYPLKLLSPMSWVRMAKGLVTDGWRQELYVTTSDNGHAKKQRLDAAYVARSREACIKEKLIDGDPQSTLIVAAEAAALSISRAFMQNNFQEITDRTRLEPEQAAALADRLISELPVQFPELLSGDASGKVLLLVIGRVMNRFAGDGAVKMTESRLSARNVARRSGTFLTTDAFAQDTLGALMALSMASNTLAGLSEGLTLSVGDRENVMHTLRALAFQAGDSSAEKSIRSFLDFYTRYGIRGTMYAETIRRYLGQKLEDIRRANVEIQTAHALAQKLKADAKLDTAQGREAAKQALALQFAASTQAQEALKKLTFKDWLEVGAKAVLETESTMAATRLTGRIAGAVVQVGALEAARGDDFDAMASLQAVAYGMDVHTAAQLQLSAEQGGQDLSGQQVIELAQFVHDPAQQLEVRLELLEHMEGSVTDRIAAALGRDQAFNEAVAAVEQARFVEGLQLLQFAPLLQMEGKPLHEVAARIAELRSYRAHSAQKQLDQQAVDAPASLSPAGKTEQSALSEMDIEDQTVAAAERDMSAAGSEVVAPDDLFIINPDGSCTIRVDINLNHFIQTYLADNPDNTITTSALATSYIDWLAADAYTDTDNDLVDRSPMRAALERMGFDLANTAHQEQLVTLFSDIFTANFDADGNGRISGTDLTAFDANETVVAADPTGQLDRVASDNIATVVFNIDITEFHLALLDALQTEDSPRSALQGAVPQGETISSYLDVAQREARLDGMEEIIRELVARGDTATLMKLQEHPELLVAASFRYFEIPEARPDRADLPEGATDAISAIRSYLNAVANSADENYPNPLTVDDIAYAGEHIETEWEDAGRLMASQAAFALDGTHVGQRTAVSLQGVFTDDYNDDFLDRDATGPDAGNIIGSRYAENTLVGAELIVMRIVAGGATEEAATNSLNTINQEDLLAAAINYAANVQNHMDPSAALNRAISNMNAGRLPDTSEVPQAYRDAIAAIVDRATDEIGVIQERLNGPQVVTVQLDAYAAALDPDTDVPAGGVVADASVDSVRYDGETIVVTEEAADAYVNMTWTDALMTEAEDLIADVDTATYADQAVHDIAAEYRSAMEFASSHLTDAITSGIGASADGNAQVAEVQSVVTELAAYTAGAQIVSGSPAVPVSHVQAERAAGLTAEAETIVYDSTVGLAVETLTTAAEVAAALGDEITWYRDMAEAALADFDAANPTSEASQAALANATYYNNLANTAETQAQTLIDAQASGALSTLAERAVDSNGNPLGIVASTVTAIEALTVIVDDTAVDTDLESAQATVAAGAVAAELATAGWTEAEAAIAAAEDALEPLVADADGNSIADIVGTHEAAINAAADVDGATAALEAVTASIAALDAQIAVAEQALADAQAVMDTVSDAGDAAVNARIAALQAQLAEARETRALLANDTTPNDGGAPDGGYLGLAEARLADYEAAVDAGATVDSWLGQEVDTGMNRSAIKSALDLGEPTDLQSSIDFLNAVLAADSDLATVQAGGRDTAVQARARQLYDALDWVHGVGYIGGNFDSISDVIMPSGGDFGDFIIEYAVELQTASDHAGSDWAASNLARFVLGTDFTAALNNVSVGGNDEPLDPVTGDPITTEQAARWIAVQAGIDQFFGVDADGNFGLRAGLTPEQQNAARFLFARWNLPHHQIEAVPAATAAPTETATGTAPTALSATPTTEETGAIATATVEAPTPTPEATESPTAAASATASATETGHVPPTETAAEATETTHATETAVPTPSVAQELEELGGIGLLNLATNVLTNPDTGVANMAQVHEMRPEGTSEETIALLTALGQGMIALQNELADTAGSDTITESTDTGFGQGLGELTIADLFEDTSPELLASFGSLAENGELENMATIIAAITDEKGEIRLDIWEAAGGRTGAELWEFLADPANLTPELLGSEENAAAVQQATQEIASDAADAGSMQTILEALQTEGKPLSMWLICCGSLSVVAGAAALKWGKRIASAVVTVWQERKHAGGIPAGNSGGGGGIPAGNTQSFGGASGSAPTP